MAKRRRSYPKKHRALLDAARPFYELMLAYQNGVCALCGRYPSELRRLDIDHDHKGMFIRGLLCVRCNRGLAGWMTPEWLRNAADYLDERGPVWFNNLTPKE